MVPSMNKSKMEQTVNRRMTKQRTIVFNTVKALGSHPTAFEIFERVRRELPGVSLSTVYRNLSILVGQGDILPVRAIGQEVHYDHNLHDHCHVQCRICGRVSDIHTEIIAPSCIIPHDTEGYNIEDVLITLIGVCPECTERTEMEDTDA